jgi:hypothetical protein
MGIPGRIVQLNETVIKSKPQKLLSAAARDCPARARGSPGSQGKIIDNIINFAV